MKNEPHIANGDPYCRKCGGLGVYSKSIKTGAGVQGGAEIEFVCSCSAAGPVLAIRKDTICAIVRMLQIGKENTNELLAQHEKANGRSTRSNEWTAKRMENEVTAFDSAMESLADAMLPPATIKEPDVFKC